VEIARAAVANHRAFFRRAAARVERIGGLELAVREPSGTLPFPRSRRGLDEAVRRIRRLRLREVGCWSRDEDPALGTLLVARGFQWGWQPHWLGLELARLPDEEPSWRIEGPAEAYPRELPYRPHRAEPRAFVELTVRVRGAVVGRAVLNPWRGVGGIYSMGVVPSARRRGIGRALTLAACLRARELGCTHAVLNATGEGEPVYRGLGFESGGLGRTWWWFPRPAPTPRRVALVEAAGFGDLAALVRLRPRGAEPRELLGHAVCTGRVEVAEWLLDRGPELAREPVDLERGATLLHVAVEWGDARLVRLALDRGADLSTRDTAHGGTPADWARFLGREELLP
jgi:GNAT superfamily N-acetyltransferase